MNGINFVTPVPGALSAPRRNNYFYGKLMDEFHFRMEQNYLNEKRWLLNRLTLGAGVLCGLEVVRSKDDGKVYILPGVALDALGREIIVPAPVFVNPLMLTDADGKPVETLHDSRGVALSICIAYRECGTEYLPVLVSDCNTQQQCAPGTILESYRVIVSRYEHGPAPQDRGMHDLCRALRGSSLTQLRDILCKQSLKNSCVAPDGDLCVCLATLQFRDANTIEIDDCTCRRTLIGNDMLLELILCLAQRVEECCPAETPPDTQNTSIDGPL